MHDEKQLFYWFLLRRDEVSFPLALLTMLLDFWISILPFIMFRVKLRLLVTSCHLCNRLKRLLFWRQVRYDRKGTWKENSPPCLNTFRTIPGALHPQGPGICLAENLISLSQDNPQYSPTRHHGSQGAMLSRLVSKHPTVLSQRHSYLFLSSCSLPTCYVHNEIPNLKLIYKI